MRDSVILRQVAAAFIPLGLAVGLYGCGPQLPRVDTMTVERPAWDTAWVQLRFDESSMTAATADSLIVTLFDAAYDTLYHGADSIVVVPDADLGSEETVLVEACGVFEAGIVCEQRPIRASPKRVRSDIEVTFPSDANMSRGSYRIRPAVERGPSDEGEWERLDAAVPRPMMAHVRVLETEDQGVRLMVPSLSGRFDLSGAEGYRDFRFFLRSAFRETGMARVEFSVSAAYANGLMPVGSSIVEVIRKTEEEQVEEVSRLAEAAGREVVGRLAGFDRSGRALVFVNEWTYSPDVRRYRAEIELHWRPRTVGIWHELVGRLEARDDGTGVRFERLRANRAARRKWDDAASGDVMDLGALDLQNRDQEED